MSFLGNNSQIHLYLFFGVYITGVVDSIKWCDESGFFGFHHDGTFCHHIVTGRILSKIRSTYDILSIEPCQL